MTATTGPEAEGKQDLKLITQPQDTVQTTSILEVSEISSCLNGCCGELAKEAGRQTESTADSSSFPEKLISAPQLCYFTGLM